MMEDWNLFLKAMEAKATQHKKEQEKHIQQVTQQDATFITIVHEQQKKIEELMITSKNIINKMTGTPQHPDNNDTQLGDELTRQRKKKKWCNNCKSQVYHNNDKC